MKRKAIVAMIVVAVAAVAAVALFKVFSSNDKDRNAPPAKPAIVKTDVATPGAIADKSKAKKRARKHRVRGTNNVSRVKRKIMPRVPIEDPYTLAERRLADKLQDASDDNDLSKVRKAVAEIMSQKNAELKNEAISALGFFGKDALSDLMKFLKDPSLEVVDSATETISSALSELEDEENGFKAEFISTLLSIEGLCGKDAIDTFAGQLESLGSSDEKLAVQTMVQLIEDGKVDKKVKARLKEAYEFVTSEEYTTFEAAEKWWNQKTEEEAAEAAEDSEADDDKPRDDVKDDSDNDDKGAQT